MPHRSPIRSSSSSIHANSGPRPTSFLPPRLLLECFSRLPSFLVLILRRDPTGIVKWRAREPRKRRASNEKARETRRADVYVTVACATRSAMRVYVYAYVCGSVGRKAAAAAAASKVSLGPGIFEHVPPKIRRDERECR